MEHQRRSIGNDDWLNAAEHPPCVRLDRRQGRGSFTGRAGPARIAMLPGPMLSRSSATIPFPMPHPIDEYRVDTPRLALSVRDHAGGEPTLLALHGLASNARWWDLVADRLVPAHRVIAVDLPGHGLSDRPDTGYDFDTVSRATSRVCSAALHHPEPVVVVGHSWGATVALSFAVNHPELTLGVICIDGGAGDLKAYFGPNWAVAEQTMRPPALARDHPGDAAGLDGLVAASRRVRSRHRGRDPGRQLRGRRHGHRHAAPAARRSTITWRSRTTSSTPTATS